jgi:adenylyltransferase/sulfurtransferase
MPVTITIPTPLRRYASGNSEMRVDAQTVGEALERLAAVYSELRKHLYTDQNTLRHFVNIYVNEEDIRHGSGPETPVKDGAIALIVPAIAGGRSEIRNRRTSRY